MDHLWFVQEPGVSMCVPKTVVPVKMISKDDILALNHDCSCKWCWIFILTTDYNNAWLTSLITFDLFRNRNRMLIFYWQQLAMRLDQKHLFLLICSKTKIGGCVYQNWLFQQNDIKRCQFGTISWLQLQRILKFYWQQIVIWQDWHNWQLLICSGTRVGGCVCQKLFTKRRSKEDILVFIHDTF